MRIGPCPAGLTPAPVYLQAVALGTAEAGEDLWFGDFLKIEDGLAYRAAVRPQDECPPIAGGTTPKGHQVSYFKYSDLNG